MTSFRGTITACASEAHLREQGSHIATGHHPCGLAGDMPPTQTLTAPLLLSRAAGKADPHSQHRFLPVNVVVSVFLNHSCLPNSLGTVCHPTYDVTSSDVCHDTLSCDLLQCHQHSADLKH